MTILHFKKLKNPFAKKLFCYRLKKDFRERIFLIKAKRVAKSNIK